MLKYIGKGNWLPNIPSRDLTDEEVKKHGGEEALLASGLYAKPERKKYQEKQSEKKEGETWRMG